MEQADLRERALTLEFWRDLLLVLTLSIVGLVYGAGFLVPLTFALLVVVLLLAVIDQVGRIRIAGRKVPRPVAHVVGMALVLLGFTLIGLILSSQAEEVAAAVPRYTERFETMVAGLVVLIGEENAQDIREALQNADLSSWVLGLLGSAGGMLKGLFLVLLYVPFLMVERMPLARKAAIAAPDRKTGEELRRVVRRISGGLQRYLGVKTFVSVLTGLASYAVMKPLGLDFAETWAVLAFALNFIPSIGSILGVVFPALVALVQFDTITPFLVIVLLCGGLQFSIGNILEPAITGRSLNLSPFLVILSLTFWTAIWGASGALLSVPIMVGFLIVFTHIPRLRWLAVLMSRDGDLTALDGRAAGVEHTGECGGTERDR
ncbi:AI-2E family transporter [Tropicimonas sp. IMCC6043]|uniref:AI-2E family transporter n=1 Tax=Tropicimonas sp. IMCC6043 TaxID=2510645 RepID=UPI00101C4EAA|nr:AI-2E family transporter [Tropicimonas sp. IMCC6043]RYH11667.1 AI-2E family transporter [Tropicimonas sp. IMCC6043]